MKLDVANSAGPLAEKIARLQALIADIDVAIAEKWPISALRVVAPAEGASRPSGAEIDLLPFGRSNEAVSQLALNTARDVYQQQIDALSAQLDAL